MKTLRSVLLITAILLTAVLAFGSGGQEKGGPVTVTFMCTEADLPKDFVDKFNAANPDINLVRVEEDWTKWIAEAMAGTAADLNRNGIGSDTAYYVKRGLFYDMTDLFKSSKVIKMEDIDKLGNASYQFDGKDFGKGAWYGLSKDYNNIGMVTYNKEMFKAAGLPMLSETQPITYQEDLYNLSKKLTRKDSAGKVTVWGTEFNWQWVKFLVSDMAYASNLSFYKDDKKSVMNDDPKLVDLWKYWARFKVEDIASNMRNPNSGWTGSAFQSDRAAIVQLGYWYGAQLMSNQGYDQKYGWAPTPILKAGAPRVTNTLGATGIVMFSKTKHPKEAFRVFEWYMAGDYGIERARTGWGIPPLFSLRSYLPEDNAYNKSRKAIAFDDAKYFKPWQASPYMVEASYTAPFDANIDDLVAGKIDANTFIKRVYEKLDQTMKLGREEVGE